MTSRRFLAADAIKPVLPEAFGASTFPIKLASLNVRQSAHFASSYEVENANVFLPISRSRHVLAPLLLGNF
jgi:hypothetical protein